MNRFVYCTLNCTGNYVCCSCLLYTSKMRRVALWDVLRILIRKIFSPCWQFIPSPSYPVTHTHLLCPASSSHDANWLQRIGTHSTIWLKHLQTSVQSWFTWLSPSCEINKSRLKITKVKDHHFSFFVAVCHNQHLSFNVISFLQFWLLRNLSLFVGTKHVTIDYVISA